METRSTRSIFVGWFFLVVLGAASAFLYTGYLKTQITQSIYAQTQKQLEVTQVNYQKELEVIKQKVNSDMSSMQTKIDSLNELLVFTKDSANGKTDNSNQLYTQLAGVKKQLEELKKNMEVLK